MYDARNGKSMASGNLVFGIIALGIVAIVFFVALKLPFSGGNSGGAMSVSDVSKGDYLETKFTDRTTRAYLSVLKDVDAAAYVQLEKRVGRAGPGPDKEMLALLEHTEDVLKSNASDLARANVKHFDEILNLSRDGLRSASRSRSEWCNGSRYVGLDKMGPAEMKEFGEQLMGLDGPVGEFAVKVNTVLLEAVRDARRNPVQYGALTASDNAVLQGLMMSMISDPQIMPLMMQSQRGGSPDDMLAKLNICDLGVTAILAVRTLPQDTKGRVWAEAVSQARSGGGDLSQFKGIGGF